MFDNCKMELLKKLEFITRFERIKNNMIDGGIMPPLISFYFPES